MTSSTDAGERDAVRGEGAEDGLEVVDVLGEGGVFERFAEARECRARLRWRDRR